MILTCPSCETRYNVEPAQLGPSGRNVRCVKCEHIWTERPPGDMPVRAALAVPDVDADVGVSVMQELEAERVRGPARGATARRSSAGHLVGWLSLASFLIVVVGGGLFAREMIVAAWAPSAAIYEMIGMPVFHVGEGLDIRIVSNTQETENNRRTLVIVGQVVNISEEVRHVPKLRASLLDVRQREIFSWVFTASKSELKPGQLAEFDTRVPEPPTNARGLSVNFFKAKEQG